MKRLTLLLLIGLVLSAGLATAAFNNSESYYASDTGSGTTWVDSSVNANDATISGGTYAGPYLGNNSLRFDGLNDYVDSPTNTLSGSMTMRFAINSNSTDLMMFVNEKSGDPFRVYLNNDGGTGGIQVLVRDGSPGNDVAGFATGNWQSGSGWYEYVISINNSASAGNKLNIYEDGSPLAVTESSSADISAIAYTDLYIGADQTNNRRYFDGRLDEVGFWNYAFSAADAAAINGSNPYAVNVSNFTITAQDAFSGASINNFTAVITSNTAGYNTTWNTTTGTITTDILSNSSFLYNITVSADNYFNRTRTNYNVSNNLVAQLAQARATFDAYEKVSGNEVFNFNITINGSTYNSTQTFALSEGSYNATFSKDGYYDKTREITVVAEEVQLYNFTDVYNHRANFTIDVLSGSATDQNFTIDIYSDDHDFSEKLSTTSGNILANLTHGNYTVWLNDSYHALQNYSVELNSSTNLTQVTLDVYTTNTISIRFLDEDTDNLINDRNITAYFTGSIVSYNRTTSNGTMLLEMINPQEYEITYNADGYSQRKYTFTLTNRTFNTLDLYLINETQDELILTSVQDSFLDPVPNAVIRAQKKNLSGTNYYTVETCTTDNNGECLLHLVLYDTTYRFLIDVDGNTVLTSADQTIKQSTLSFRVNLEQDSLENINNIFGITGSLFYDKANSNIEFTWNDQNSLGVTACLDIDTRQGATVNDYNLSCTTSASGTIILPIDTNLSVTYEATGYVIVDGKRYDLDTISVSGNTFGSGMGLNGLFIFGFIVVGIAAFTGLWNPVVGPITTAAAIWFFNYIGFITIGTAAVTSLIIGAIMVAYLSRS